MATVANISDVTFSSTADAGFFEVTLPVTAGSGDEVVIGINFYWNRSLTWEDTVTQVHAASDGSIRQIRVVRRVLDGTEGATFRVDFNSNSSAEAYAMIVANVDWASDGTADYVAQSKPRMYFPNTVDSLTTDSKLWLFFGWHVDETATFTPTPVNMVEWEPYADKAVDAAFFAARATSQQSLVGSGDFPYWDGDGAFEAMNATVIHVDITGGAGLPATALSRHGDSLLKYLKDNAGVTASEVVSALNEYNGVTSPPRKEYKEARDTAFGINGH